MWPWLVAALVVIAVLVGGFLYWRFSRNSKKMVSLVLMLRDPRDIDAHEVRRAATKAFGVRIGSTMDEENFVVQHTPEATPVMVNGLPMGFLCVKTRYAEVDTNNMDPRLARVLDEHQAWIAVDAADRIPPHLKPMAYQHMGRLLAEFVDDNVLGIYSTETDRLMWNTPDLKDKLRSEDPLSAVQMVDPAIIMVQDDDQRLAATVEEAQRRWTEFVNAYASRQQDEVFAVKLRFTEGDKNEFMWILVSDITGDTVTGRLDNSPGIVKNVQEGDTVTAKHADVQDWMFQRNGQMVGGFSLKVLAGN